TMKPLVLLTLLLTSSCVSQKAITAPTPVRRNQEFFKDPEIMRRISVNVIESEYPLGKLSELCDQAVAKHRAALDAITRLDPAQRTFENTMLALETMNAELRDTTRPLTFLMDVSPNDALRNEAAACDKNISKYTVETFTRRDVYDVLKTVKSADGLMKKDQ